MKKIISLLCSISLIIAFTACEPQKPSKGEPNTPGTIQPDPEDPDNNDPAPKASFEDWLGEWTVTSTKTITWDLNTETSDLTKTVTDTPMQFDVSIIAAATDTILIAGFSFLGSEWPALATYDPETGYIAIQSGITMGKADEDGFVATWAGYMVDKDGNFLGYENETFTTYTMKKDGFKATSTHGKRTYDGIVYDVLSTEIYGFKKGYNKIRVFTGDEQYPIDHAAGEFTWIKK